MNKANLKSYAPKARLDFIKAVTERANVLGISAAGAVPAEVRGDVAIIDGREWPAKVAGQREELLSRIKRQGFELTMDEVAYTWFNRFAALRYMEIHDYLDHGWRVLSSRDGGLPEILRHASEVSLPGLNADRAREMQLAGNQDNELYKLLLVAQCNELSRVMPFLFERIDDDSELLLPENLLRTDSIVAKLVESVPEEDWQEIEVIGWLYQFYISEKKDQVIGKVVKSEDIPAATQLFTPNWIVQYLVQNSVGRLWLMANPTSTLASQWPYYIQPAEQTPEVQAQLDALIQTRVREDGETLNPETITVLDPACGSGHILVVAYDVLKAIYLERGYQPRSIPRLILEKNLYGLDIDDRAAQLAAFALLMKARADDRRLLDDPPRLNVCSLRESRGLDMDEIVLHLTPFGVRRDLISSLLSAFEHTHTFGSLVQLDLSVAGEVKVVETALLNALRSGDLYARQASKEILPLFYQGCLLTMHFDAVVANPPYMGGSFQNSVLKQFLQAKYRGYEKDLFSAFIVRNSRFAKPTGFCGFMSPFVWMFISSYERIRKLIISENSLQSLIQLEYNASGDVRVPLCTFLTQNSHISGYRASFVKLSDFPGLDIQSMKTLEAIHNKQCGWFYESIPDDFRKIPTTPIAFWASDKVLNLFQSSPSLGSLCVTRTGMSTGMNAKFVRLWTEVGFDRIGLDHDRTSAMDSKRKWFPYANGGPFRKWFGNVEDVVDWHNDGHTLQTEKHESGRIRSHNHNLDYIFKEGVSWSDITSSSISARLLPRGSLFSSVASSLFSEDRMLALALINSAISKSLLTIINPTLHFNPGDVSSLPVSEKLLTGKEVIIGNVKELVEIAQRDWNSFEISWSFSRFPFLPVDSDSEGLLSRSWSLWDLSQSMAFERTKELEELNNQILLKAYEMEAQLRPEVPDGQITLFRAERQKDCLRLISYAIGCMMGRFSLDEPGLIYAQGGGVGFDSNRYAKRFLADADGIVPITDERWYEDDAAIRIREFLNAVWGSRTQEENLAWLAESLGAKGNETADETIRRYLAEKFFKDHLHTYRKRPIYWLFSSGKQGAFQALVYLHRYNGGTLARMRAEYVVPLISKMASRLEMLNQDVIAASSAAARTKLQKQIEALRKKQLELLTYDEKLRHYADMRITLDLDDGVKVNYAKFGDLVAESKAITGGSDD